MYGRHNITFHPLSSTSQYSALMPPIVRTPRTGVSAFMPGGMLPFIDPNYFAGLLPQHFVTPFLGGASLNMQSLVHGGNPPAQAGLSGLS